MEFTLTDFVNFLSKSSKSAHSTIQKECKGNIQTLLTKTPVNYPENKADKVAANLVECPTEESKCMLQFNSLDAADVETQVNAMVKNLKAVKFNSYMFLVAPSDPPDDRLTWKHDMEARRMHFKQFCLIISDAMKVDYEANPKCEAMTYEGMCIDVEKFLQGEASNSAMAILIFSGHGVEGTGEMVFSDNRHVSPNDFVEKVANILCGIRGEGKTLPLKVTIVFTHCYGHMVEEPKHGDLVVRPLTSSDNPETFCTYKLDSKGNILKARFDELEEYAQEERDTIAAFVMSIKGSSQ